MEDIESTPLVAKTTQQAHNKSSSTPKYTFLAVALLISLGLIAVCVPNASRALSVSTKVMSFEVALTAKEDRIFKLADADRDVKVSPDEVNQTIYNFPYYQKDCLIAYVCLV